MPKYPTNSWRAREALMDHEAYVTSGSMYTVAGPTLPEGNRLPLEWRRTYLHAEREIIYTVVSYRTPIAWVLRSGELVIPDVKYSRTTSGHQGLLYVLKLNGESQRDARAGIRDAAQRERQAERNKRAERNAQRREQNVGTYRSVTYGGIAVPNPLANLHSIESYSERLQGGFATLATEDPTASVQDRIAALEAETLKEASHWSAEGLPSGDIVQRINDALAGL